MTELQQLRDRVAELEDMLGMTAKFPRGIFPPKMVRLRESESMLGMLMAREIVPAQVAYEALYGMRPECDQPTPAVIPVLVHDLRNALEKHDVKIKTIWGKGYYIEPEDKQRLHGVIAQYRAAA